MKGYILKFKGKGKNQAGQIFETKKEAQTKADFYTKKYGYAKGNPKVVKL